MGSMVAGMSGTACRVSPPAPGSDRLSQPLLQTVAHQLQLQPRNDEGLELKVLNPCLTSEWDLASVTAGLGSNGSASISWELFEIFKENLDFVKYSAGF